MNGGAVGEFNLVPEDDAAKALVIATAFNTSKFQGTNIGAMPVPRTSETHLGTSIAIASDVHLVASRMSHIRFSQIVHSRRGAAK